MDKKIASAYLPKQVEREEIIKLIMVEFKFSHLCYFNMVLNFLNGLTFPLLRYLKDEMFRLKPLKNIEKLKAIIDIIERRIGD